MKPEKFMLYDIIHYFAYKRMDKLMNERSNEQIHDNVDQKIQGLMEHFLAKYSDLFMY